MRRAIKNLSEISPPAFSILKGGLRLCCTMLICAIFIISYSGPFSASTYILYRHAELLRDLTFSVLFITIFGSAFVEERIRKSNR